MLAIHSTQFTVAGAVVRLDVAEFPGRVKSVVTSLDCVEAARLGHATVPIRGESWS